MESFDNKTWTVNSMENISYKSIALFLVFKLENQLFIQGIQIITAFKPETSLLESF